MPEGYLWDMADYVPALLDAQLTGRGGWKWASDPVGAEIQGGIHASFKTGERLLIIGSDAQVWDVNTATGATTSRGTATTTAQNPVMIVDKVVVPSADSAQQPKILTAPTSSSLTIGDVPAMSAPNTNRFRYATVYKNRVIGGNMPGAEERIVFSTGDAAAAWDVNSFWNTSLPLTGVGALRSMILLFHAGSVERLRGSIRPATDPDPDMLPGEPVRPGRLRRRQLDRLLERQLHLRRRARDPPHRRRDRPQPDLAGGAAHLLAELYRTESSIAACTYLDYYIVSVVRTDGIAITLVCDLNRRTLFRFTNVARPPTPLDRIAGAVLGGSETDNRLIVAGRVLLPHARAADDRLDADGAPVLPFFESPWYRLADAGAQAAALLLRLLQWTRGAHRQREKEAAVTADPGSRAHHLAERAVHRLHLAGRPAYQRPLHPAPPAGRQAPLRDRLPRPPAGALLGHALLRPRRRGPGRGAQPRMSVISSESEQRSELTVGPADERPLTDEERKLVTRMFGDPFAFPQTFKTWLVAFLEGSDVTLPLSSVLGLSGILGGGSGSSGIMGVLPAGIIFPCATKSPPAGTLLCNGSLKPKAQYRRLWDAIGNQWGPADAGEDGNFTLPDVQGRAIIGTGPGWPPNANEGLAAVNRGPSHQHTVRILGGTSDASHDHNMGAGFGFGGGSNQGVLYNPGSAYGARTDYNTHSHAVDITGTSSGSSRPDQPSHIAIPMCINY